MTIGITGILAPHTRFLQLELNQFLVFYLPDDSGLPPLPPQPSCLHHAGGLASPLCQPGSGSPTGPKNSPSPPPLTPESVTLALRACFGATMIMATQKCISNRYRRTNLVCIHQPQMHSFLLWRNFVRPPDSIQTCTPQLGAQSWLNLS